MEKEKFSYTWKVEQQITAEKQHSPYFEYDNKQWRLLTFTKHDAISLFLECKTPPICARFKLIYRDHHMVARHKFTAQENDWGYTTFMQLAEFGPDNEFTVEIEIIPESHLKRLDYNSKTETGYVGIQNQGATCYMNSLLQSLYFTNEFRRSVYTVKSDKKLVQELQRLFYHLQTEEDAVDTRELTKSFGWNSMDAFMQHDVQEFNRVLQDALEKEMDGTIERLFTGKMASYIKCINVDYTSTREETFYDIQLNVKGMNSLEESFKDYVQTETLNGENQYQSEKFGLQDAVKGVIFKQLPPILHLQLKRFEYDFQRDAMVKINDRFEFPPQIDLREYLDPECEAYNEDQKYSCYGVLVHAGDVHGGHYIAYIHIEQKWHKFNDDLVTASTLKEVYDENFGGDSTLTTPGAVRTKAQLLKKFTNAYMLVYIRDRDAATILKPISLEDVPVHLKDAYQREKEDRQVHELEIKERHLYCQVAVLKDEDFKDHQGFDLFKMEDLKSEKVLRETAWNNFAAQHGGELWSFQKRTNKTIRLEGKVEKADTVGQFWNTCSRHLASTVMPLYCPKQIGNIDSNTILVFFKYFDGHKLEVCGGVKVNQNLKGADLLPIFNQMKDFQPGTQLKVYEEVKPGMIDALRMSKSLQQVEIGSGDILVFQKEGLPVSVPQHFDFISNKLTLPMASIAGDVQFDLEVSKKTTHDQLAQIVADKIGLDKSDRLRFWINGTGGSQPQVPIKRMNSASLQEIFSTLMYNQDIKLFVWYEILDMSASQMELLRQIPVVLLDKFYREKEVVNVMVHRTTGTVADLVTTLKSKHPHVPIIKVIEVVQSRKIVTLSADQTLANFQDVSSQICIETEVYQDPDIACKAITVFHFNRETAHSYWGIPVLLHVKPGLTVGDLKAKIKDRLAIPDKEMLKIKLYLVNNYSTAKQLEDDGAVFEFTEKDQIGLDHADKRRTYQAERSIKIG